MKTKYKFIHFSKTGMENGRMVWDCLTNKTGDKLGEVAYYPPWRRYCYSPDSPAVYDVGCLETIIEFMRQIE